MTGGARSPLAIRAKRGRKERCKGMSIKERLELHRQIERENAEHLRDFLKGVKRDDVGANEG